MHDTMGSRFPLGALAISSCLIKSRDFAETRRGAPILFDARRSAKNAAPARAIVLYCSGFTRSDRNDQAATRPPSAVASHQGGYNRMRLRNAGGSARTWRTRGRGGARQE
jgi:hypothetical protein